MGLDLTLVPKQWGKFNPHARDWFLAHTRIDLDRDYYIFDQIENHRDTGVRQVCDPKSMPGNVDFDWYYDDGHRKTLEDPYGSPLKFVLARELTKVNLSAGASAWNKAVFAMIRALPPETPVVLWWH
jgi:hypothetical protein